MFLFAMQQSGSPSCAYVFAATLSGETFSFGARLNIGGVFSFYAQDIAYSPAMNKFYVLQSVWYGAVSTGYVHGYLIGTSGNSIDNYQSRAPNPSPALPGITSPPYCRVYWDERALKFMIGLTLSATDYSRLYYMDFPKEPNHSPQVTSAPIPANVTMYGSNEYDILLDPNSDRTWITGRNSSAYPFVSVPQFNDDTFPVAPSVTYIGPQTTVFQSTATNYNSGVLLPGNRAVAAFNDSDNKGALYVHKLGFTDTNSARYIGISQAAVSDGETLSVAIAGAYVEGFTGLEPGRDYYLDEDGAISQYKSKIGKIGFALDATSMLLGEDAAL